MRATYANVRAGMEGAIADLVLYKGSEKTTMPEPRGCYNGVSILLGRMRKLKELGQSQRADGDLWGSSSFLLCD
ncbi:hypothetical protein CDAR_309621, partial [Caerostris darwini]